MIDSDSDAITPVAADPDTDPDTAEGGSDLTLHRVKKVEIIVRGEKAGFIRELLERSGVTGYTLIRDIAGMGHHGFHEGRLLFNDSASLVMIVAVAPTAAIERIAGGLKPLLRKSSGVMFVSDVQVLRLDYFTRQAAGDP